MLYGVTGCGLGHTMRARALAQHLRSRGHDVQMAASGRAVGILRQHGLDVVAIEGMKMRFEEGAVRRGWTAIDLLKGASRAVKRNAEVALSHVRSFDPEVVLTDFDSFAHLTGQLLGVPVVSVDHQHVLDRFCHSRRVAEHVTSFRMARAVVTAKTPRCAHYVVTSFFFPEPRWGSTTLVGPIVRPEVAAATPTRGEHVLVYQTAAGDPRLLPALGAVPDVRFVLYGLGREQTLGNIELHRFDESRFVADLASARAVIANGGFTTLSEAITLGKPVLSVPVRRQTEQELNAAYVEELGIGVRATHIASDVVTSFLARVDGGEFYRDLDPRVGRGTEDAKAAVDQAIAEAV
jgi:uncharacterized protein (TIGR00661 family)